MYCIMEAIKKYCIVTGGSGGLGKSVCNLLPSIGLSPIVCYRSNEALAHEIANVNNGLVLRINLSDFITEEDFTRNIATLIDKNSIISGAILLASPPPLLNSINKIDVDSFENHLRVSVLSNQILLSYLINTHFKPNKNGFIIGISSIATGGLNSPPIRGMGSYIVAKTALEKLLEVYKEEFSWLKVKIFKPGYIATNMLNVFHPRIIELLRENNNISNPDEIASSIIKEICQ